MREIKHNNICSNCNSSEKISGNEYIHCGFCGIQIEKMGFDSGYIPKPGDFLNFTSDSNRNSILGSNIAKSKDKTTEKLRRTHNNFTKIKPLIFDCIIDRIKHSGEGFRIVSECIEILKIVNMKNPIGKKRDKFKGSLRMNKNSKRTYKERVYAAALLYILNSKECRNTRAVQIADEWEILYNDLVKIVSFLKKNMKLVRESPNQIRTRELQYNLRNTRDFLTEQIGIVKANEVMRKAEIILENEGEPLEINDEWYTGKYVNKPSNKAVMMSFVEAMSLMKIEKSIAKKLFQRLPIPGMKYYFENISKKFL